MWRRSGGRLPITLQLALLLLVSLGVAQLMIFLIAALTPPPPRSVFSLSEVAEALRGGDLAQRNGRRLIRAVQNEPPAEGGRTPSLRAWLGRDLAALLGVNPADVQLVLRPPRVGPLGMRSPVRPRFEGGPGPPFPGDEASGAHRPGPPPGPSAAPPWIMPGPAGFAAASRPLTDDFVAGVRRTDGRWLVVHPSPERFPTDWQRRIFLWYAGSFLLVAPLGYVFARRITAPLRAFAEAAETLGRDPTAPQMTLTGPAEIGMAARAFNDMQARLKRYVDDRTGMVGAISHDLRTPLARIRFKIEDAPKDLRDRVLGDVEQIEQMVSSVLDFIRDGAVVQPRQRIDLLSVLECLADDENAIGHDVEVSLGKQAAVEGDLLGLQRLFGNLVANAVKYGERARIRLWTEGDDAVIEIADEGPGLSEREIERVFEPFYRAEAARTLDGGGVGLGLAVARSIARAHGGELTLRSTPNGLIATAHIPLARPSRSQP